MRYLSVEEGRQVGGLRLVLTQGVPGPWGEAAKAILRVKGLDYLALAQEAGGDNTALHAWTGQVSAPVAAWNDEPPCTDSVDILFLAERLAPSPRLIPEDVAERARMFGITREIIGRRGLGWMRRVMLIAPLLGLPDVAPGVHAMAERYGCHPDSVDTAEREVARILEFLSGVLATQRGCGSHYFVGNTLTAADLYWAAFSVMLQPLSETDCPMPEYLRAAYGATGPGVAAALVPELIAHRDFIFREHIGLPMDFLPT